ncbi:MAG: TIGR04283 family arsenosugar biosynthesis glycosyltransferase [Bacteroidota bacterium]
MLSIVIPVLNERPTIRLLLRHLDKLAHPGTVNEVIVVDGGSDDGTHEAVCASANELDLDIVFISSERGRAAQMNAGARKATGSILYFLHADSFPPHNFDHLILNKLDDGFDAGSFRMKFDSSHPVLKFSQWFTRFNWKMCRGGDQSLFIRRSAFEALGGFNTEYAIYEDCEFIGRVYDDYKFTIIQEPLTTSARKYDQVGTVKLQYHFTVIHLKRFLGASPERLRLYYHRNIKH